MSKKTGRRFDRYELKKAEMTPQGFLKAPAFATRVGVFTYRGSDGQMIKELRPPVEVFNADSMKTLANVPVTNLHPKAGLLSAKNAKDLTVGYTGDLVENIEEKYLQVSVIVIDQETIKEAEKGMQELSCGYLCDLDPTPGIYEGEHYDFVQKNIVYNHLAIVPRGRAGPEVKLHLDADDAEMVQENEQQKKGIPAMEKIKLNDKEFDVHPELAEAFKAHQKDMDDSMNAMKDDHQSKMDAMKKQIDDMRALHPEERDVPGTISPPGVPPCEDDKSEMEGLKKEKDSLQAKADALEADLKKIKETRFDMSDDKKLHAMVAERIKLLNVASRLLPTSMKVDEMTDIELKKEIIKADSPEVIFEGKSTEYVNARFDHIQERFTKIASDRTTMGDAIVKNTRRDAQTPDAEVARKKMMEESKNAWKTPSTKEGK